MQTIDFSSLSYKIKKPSIDLSLPNYTQNFGQIKLKMQNYLTFEETQASNSQQQTANPFRRTCHLFKHINRQNTNDDKSYSVSHSKKGKLSSSLNTKSQPYLNVYRQNKQQVTFSLENFSSFNNKNQSNQSAVSYQFFQPKSMSSQINQNDAIKIETSEYQYSEELSLIMDDFNCEMGDSDLIAPVRNSSSLRRIKTEYSEKQNEEWKANENTNVQKPKTKLNNAIFCLTAQEQSEQSSIKQFYFDLRAQKIKMTTKFHQNDIHLKKQLKSLLHDFIDELEIMNQSEIDPSFYEKLQNCLIGVKKIVPLTFFREQKRNNQFVINNKTNQVDKNYNKKMQGEKIPLQSRKWIEFGNKNKQNTMGIKNIYEGDKKNQKINNKFIEQSCYNSMKKRKWVY